MEPILIELEEMKKMILRYHQPRDSETAQQVLGILEKEGILPAVANTLSFYQINKANPDIEPLIRTGILRPAERRIVNVDVTIGQESRKTNLELSPGVTMINGRRYDIFVDHRTLNQVMSFAEDSYDCIRELTPENRFEDRFLKSVRPDRIGLLRGIFSGSGGLDGGADNRKLLVYATELFGNDFRTDEERNLFESAEALYSQYPGISDMEVGFAVADFGGRDFAEMLKKQNGGMPPSYWLQNISLHSELVTMRFCNGMMGNVSYLPDLRTMQSIAAGIKSETLRHLTEEGAFALYSAAALDRKYSAASSDGLNHLASRLAANYSNGMADELDDALHTTAKEWYERSKSSGKFGITSEDINPYLEEFRRITEFKGYTGTHVTDISAVCLPADNASIQ